MRHTFVVWLVHLTAFTYYAVPEIYTPTAAIFAIMAIVTQASLLCLPMFLLAQLVRGHQLALKGKFTQFVRTVLLTALGISMLALLYTNYSLKGMYGFYIDSFVWNLMTTPGGMSALGASNSFFITTALGIGAITAGYYIAVNLFSEENLLSRIAGREKFLLIALMTIFAIQGGSHALAEYKSYTPVLVIGDQIPWYQAITAKSSLEKMGFESSRSIVEETKNSAGSGLIYPKPFEKMIPLENRYNIVWLVAESWRWDMLDPQIMPATWELAQQSHRFDNHYSTGNGTRMGVFGQFYGLSGEFWFPALKYQHSPFLVDVLQRSGYQIQAYTSASFTYPEFDKTVWLNVPNENLQSIHEGVSWKRDQENVTDLIEFSSASKQPFFTYMFFESTHANYNYPEKNRIQNNVIEDFDYLSTDIEKSIDQIKNRYINASNYLDSQISRIASALEAQGIMDETILIVTGDHGEEFLENGHWGHNSTFSQQQTKVPLLIHIPNKKPTIHSALSSHLDVAATILSSLKPNHDTSLYGMGSNLLAKSYSRDFAIVSDWHGDALVTKEHKLSMSSKANLRGLAITDLKDKPVADSKLPKDLALALSKYISDRRIFQAPSFD